MKKARKILLAAMLLVCVLALTSCGKTKVDLKEYTTIEFDGLNTRAKIDLDVDEEALALAIWGDIPESEAAQWTYVQKTILLGGAFEYEATPCENLSNGDVVTITVYPDEAAMEELGIAVKQTEWKVTVEGLVEGKEIDLFKDLEIVYSGLDGDGRVDWCHSTSEDPFLANMHYSVEPMLGLTNGDVVVVTADCNQSYAEKCGYLLPESMTLEIVVDGLGYYLDKSEQLTESILQQAWDAARQKLTRIGMATTPEKAHLFVYQESEAYTRGVYDVPSSLIFVYEPENGFEPYEAVAFECLAVNDNEQFLGGDLKPHDDYVYGGFGAEYDGETIDAVWKEIQAEFSDRIHKYEIVEIACSGLK